MRRYLKYSLFGLALLIGAWSAATAQMRIDGIPAVITGTKTHIGHLLFSPDNTYDIGASGATRPRNVYVANNLVTSAVNFGVSRAIVKSPADGEINILNNAEDTSGSVRAKYVVEANTGTKAPSALESREIYTNTGDADGSIINLLDDPTVGLSYTVAVTAAQTITINTGTGETIWLAGTSCGTDIAGSDTGASLIIIAVVGGSGGIWHAIGSGTWTC